jgi:hypothetical protein
MPATFSHFDNTDSSCHTEPGLPYFLDSSANDGDDLNDWWLDLGAVDLS